MRSIVVDGMTRTPDAPLNETFRAVIRQGGTLPYNERIQARGEQRLAEAVSRLLSNRDERPVWVAAAERLDIATLAATQAVEDAMAAQHRLGRPLQILPITLTVPSLDRLSAHASDVLGEIARGTEREGTRELVDRAASIEGAGGDAANRLRSALRGVVHLEQLERMVGDAVGDTDLCRAFVDAIWQGFQVRANRVVHDPSPWFISELQRETNQLAAVIDEHHRLAQARLSFVEKALDIVFAAAIGAIVGGAVFPFTNSLAAVGSALIASGATALLRRRSRVAESFEPEGSAVPRRPSMSLPPAPQREAVDVGDVVTAFDDYVQALRGAGLVPVIIWEGLGTDGAEPERYLREFRKVLGQLPRGLGSIIVAPKEILSDRPTDGPIPFWVQPSLTELHGYLRRRIPIPLGMGAATTEAARLERAVLELAYLHAGGMDPRELDAMLADRRVGQLPLSEGAPSDQLALRVRATQQLAVEVILRESQAEMAADPDFARLLPVVLGLPLRQWEQDIPPVVSDPLLAQHLQEYTSGYAWTQLPEEARNRLRTAVSKLLGVFTSRAWLVSVLPDTATAFADIVPEWPLLTQKQGLSVWTFRHDGSPRFDPEELLPVEQTLAPAKPEVKKPSADRSARLRALLERSSDGMNTTEPVAFEPVRDYLGDFTPARASAKPTPAVKPFSDPHPSDADLTIPPDGFEHDDEPGNAWDTALSAVQLLEALDDVLAELSDTRLSVSHLIRCGLLPCVPTAEAIREALHDEADPRSQCILAEVSHRIRERLGVIEKFLLWVKAVDVLTQGEHDILEIAAVIVTARDLRGRPAAEQHARIPTRVLKAELRHLCPATRGASAIFKRSPLPRTDVDGLVQWGDDLEKRLEMLNYALREGVSDSVLDDAAWGSFAQRLRAIVVDGEEVLSGFAEILSALDRRGPARLTDWLVGRPSCRQLSRVLLAGDDAGPQDSLVVAKACGAVLLGLNRDGLQAVQPEYLDSLDRPLIDTLEDAGPCRQPFICVVAGANPGLVADGPTPTSGSVFVGETPYDVDIFGRRPDAFLHEEDYEGPRAENEMHLSLPAADTIDDVIEWLRRFG